MSYAVLNTTVSDDILDFLRSNKFTIVQTSREFNQLTGDKHKSEVARQKRREYYSRPDVVERRKNYMSKQEVKEKRREYARRKDVLERKKKQSQKRRELIEKIRSKDPQLYAEIMLSADGSK